MEKRILVGLSIAILTSTSIVAQSSKFKHFKVDLGVATMITTNPIVDKGMGFYFSPIFNATNRLSVGARFGFNYLSIEPITTGIGYMDFGIIGFSSFLIVGDYYLSIEHVRAFIGLGFGFYRQREMLMTTSLFPANLINPRKSNIGIMPRLGFNVGHFKMTIAYNSNGYELFNYVDVTLGMDIGGGSR